MYDPLSSPTSQADIYEGHLWNAAGITVVGSAENRFTIGDGYYALWSDSDNNYMLAEVSTTKETGYWYIQGEVLQLPDADEQALFASMVNPMTNNVVYHPPVVVSLSDDGLTAPVVRGRFIQELKKRNSSCSFCCQRRLW